MKHHAIVHRRIQFLFVGTLLIFAVIVCQLFSVQVVRANSISAKANRELQNYSVLLAPRGLISDVNGVELARSVAAVNIVVDQTEITDPAKAAEITAPVLNMPVADLQALYTGKLMYKKVAVNATPETWIKLQDALSTYNSSVMKERGGLEKRIVGFFSERGYIR